MPLTSRKRYPNRVSRRKIPGVGAETDRPRRQEITILGLSFGVGTATLILDQDVSLAGVPQFNSGAGFPTAASVTAPGTVVITGYTGTPTTIHVPFEDPAIRNMAGGFVRPGDYEAI